MRDRTVTAVYAGAIGLLPIWITLAHRAIAPTVILLGLLAASRSDLWRAGIAALRPPRSALALAMLAFAGFSLWASITGFWAPRGDAPRLGLSLLAPVLAGGAAVFEIARNAAHPRSLLPKTLVWVGGISVLLLAFEAASGALLRDITPPTDESQGRIKDWISLGRGATVVASVIFGALLLTYRFTARKWLVALLFALALFAAYRFHIFANLAGMALGAAVFAFALLRPRAAIWLVAALWLAAFGFSLLAVFIPAEEAMASLAGYVPVSWGQRLVIWQYAAEQALACQPFGCGADFARSLRETGGQIALPGWPLPASRMPVHPHNLFLQIWLEFGVVGVLLFAAALYNAARAVAAAPLSGAVKAAIAATAASLLISALVEMSLWQVWRLAAPCLAGVYIAAAARFDAQTAGSPSASS